MYGKRSGYQYHENGMQEKKVIFVRRRSDRNALVYLYNLQIKNFMSLAWLEMTGFSVTLISVWLVIKERRSGWIWSILSAVIYFFVYLEANLYSDAEIQFLYMAVGVYGYINWNRRKRTGAPVIKMATSSSFL